MVQNYFKLVLLLMVVFSKSYAQNLVPNSSFEDYNACPTNINGTTTTTIAYSPSYTSFPTVKGWVSPLTLPQCTADYFNACGASNVNVPSNQFGYQPARTGNAYAGLWSQSSTSTNLISNFNEYIETKLLHPMVGGHRYYACFYVNSPGWFSATSFSNNGVMDNIGMLFSSTVISSTTNPNFYIAATPSISNTPGNYIEDTVKWIKIEGVYTATGNEQWAVIGSFRDGGTVSFKPFIPATYNASYTNAAYRYVDDVFVMDMLGAKTTNSDTIVCASYFPMTLKGTQTGSHYTWNTGDTTATIAINDTGTYYVEAWGDTMVYIDTIHVLYENLLKLDIGNDTTYCNTSSVIVQANSTGYQSYLWSTGGTTFGIKVTQSGTYTLEATGLCSKAYDTIHISMLSMPGKPVVRDTTICKDAPAPLLIVLGDGLKWYDNNGKLLSADGQPAINTDNVGTQTLYLTQSNICGESDKQPLNITTIGLPTVNISQADTVLCKGNSLQLTATSPDGSISWNTGDKSNNITVSETGTYIVSVANQCGSDSDKVTTEFNDCTKCVWIPDAFTPNGDGRNDYFYMVTSCPITSYSLVIVNRWGQTVFQSDDVKQKWDGTYSGAPAAMGTYYYVLKTTPGIGGSTVITMQGDITLIR